MQRAGRRPISRAESEYEEIGPARDRIGGGSHVAALPPSPPCDLCGNPNPFVRCRECLDQNFCAACDEMYHKHPKRACHVRKPLASLASAISATARVEMPGSGPVAPPRSSRRKGAMSAEPSPAPSRTSTLPRKPNPVIGQNGSSQSQNPMAGRPLPPPPPVQPEKGPTPPPVLPKKSASVSHMAGMMGKQMPGGLSRASQPGIPMPISGQTPAASQWTQQPRYPNQSGGGGTNPYPSFGPNGGLSYPRGSSAAGGGQFGNNQVANPSSFPGNGQYPTLPQQPSQFSNNNNNSSQFQGQNGSSQYPRGPGGFPGGQFPAGAGQYPRGPVAYPASEGGQGPAASKYLDEVRFPPKETSVEPPNVGGRRSSAQVGRSKGRFANRVVNRSSSMHDLARTRLEPGPAVGDVGEGVRWQDEQARMAGRTTSTASLHMLGAAMPHGSEVMWGQGQLPPGSVPMWGPGMPGMPGMPGAMPGQPIQPFHPMVGAWPGQAGVGMMPGGQVPLAGQQGLRGSMHELNRNFLRPTSPIGSEKSTRSKKSNRSNRSNGSKNSTRRSKAQRNKENGERRERRTGSNSKERGTRTSSKNKKHRESSDEDSEDFFTGESDEEFVSISSNSDKAPRVSWTCEHCTYVNNPGVKVCAMCCKTSKNSREVVEKRKEEERKKKEKEKKKGNRRSFHSSDGESDKEAARRKGKSRKEVSSDSEEEKRRRREKKKGKAGYKSRHSSESELDEDAVAAYYAVRIDKSQGMTITAAAAEGRYGDSSSESASAHNPRNLPVLDAPAPAKGILKKANSNLNLAKADGMSEVGTISEVGYITNKLTQRLKARGQHDVLDSPDLKGRRTDTSSDDIWQQEKENWLRQKEELKAWAAAQGGSTDLHKSPASPRVEELVQESGVPGARMYRTLSGFSLGDAPEAVMSQQGRRGSEQVAVAGSSGGGKRSFRSKRFSRNLDPARGEPAGTGMRRAQSFHIDQREDNDSWLDSQRRSFQRANSKNSLTSEMFGGRLSDSESGEEGPHFTSTVTSSTRGPGGVGSYLARQEFGSSEVAGQPGPDSGYVSHSSGGGYPKLQVPMSNAVKSFTMSMDRGFLGGPTKPSVVPSNPNMEFNRFRSMEDLGGKQEKTAGWELVRLLREAEKSGFTSEDVQVAVNHCGEVNPIAWLTENWGNMIETVMTLASNVGHEAEENTIGTISKAEAREALRKHKGNIWASVTECVEGRQQKYDELASKGNFSREDIVTMLTAHEGSSDAAFQELNKAQLKPFLMRIWGQAEPGESSGGAPPPAAIGDQEDDAFEDAAEPDEKEKIGEAAGGDEGSEQQPEEVIVNNKLLLQQPGDLIRNVDLLPIDPEQQKFERQVRRYLAEGKVKSYEQGELVVKLLEKEFGEEEVFIVIKEATTEEEAVALLRRECELCASVMTIQQVVKMPNCEHCCCQECAKNFFTLVVTDQNISQAVCPFCREPTNLANDDDAALAYYAKLDLLLKPIIDQDTHDLFQRKLRDRTLMKDPNFKWCYKCPFGFLADPKNKKLVCPDCRAMSCAKCLVPWEPQHEGISCADFARWKEENNPDTQAEGVEAHLAEHGISCPSCNFRYTLTKGGCMHFTCTQCKFEFCIGCNRPFKLGTKCGRDPGCAKLGLHAHHPRNCLFYLRDKEPADLQKLLKKNNVEYLTAPRDGDHSNRACRVQVQKETEDGMEDGVCGEVTPTGHAGYCRTHYVEYLCGLVIRHKLEVVSLMELGEVKAVFTRAGKFIPRQRPGEYEFKYLKRLAQMVEEEVPLDTA